MESNIGGAAPLAVTASKDPGLPVATQPAAEIRERSMTGSVPGQIVPKPSLERQILFAALRDQVSRTPAH